MQTEFPRLFARAKTGETKWWWIAVQGTEQCADVVIQHAAGLDHVVTETRERIVEGKNIGRANETTPFQQASAEAEARWRKKRDSGYKEAVLVEDAEHNTNALGLPQPMLALSIDKIKFELPEQVWVQPKLDGHRALAGWVDGQVRLWSRRGKWIDTMDHILASLNDVLPEDTILDGELYIHGRRLQDIGSLIKRKQAGSEDVQYHVYDVVDMARTFSLRHAYLAGMFFPDRCVEPVLAVQCPPDQIAQHFAACRDAGYEGAMVRLDTHPYEPGYRSQSLLKVKEFHDREWIVRDVVKGVPKNVAGGMLDVAVLVCDGFAVTAPGTVQDKDHVWRHREQYIGKTVTVKYAYLTKDGVPFHPVALRFRDDI